MIRISGKFEYVSFRNKNGKLHRLDGPAVLYSKNKSWYIESIRYNESEYHEKLKEMGFLYDRY